MNELRLRTGLLSLSLWAAACLAAACGGAPATRASLPATESSQPPAIAPTQPPASSATAEIAQATAPATGPTETVAATLPPTSAPAATEAPSPTLPPPTATEAPSPTRIPPTATEAPSPAVAPAPTSVPPAATRAPQAAVQPPAPTLPPIAEGREPTLTPVAAGSPQAAFFRQIAPWAQAEQKDSGVPASFSMALAATETSYGLSPLARQYNNYLNVGCGRPNEGLPCVQYGNGLWNQYSSPQAAFLWHGRWMRAHTEAFGEAFKHTDNVADFTRLAATCYVNCNGPFPQRFYDAIMQTIDANHLRQFDAQPASP